MVRSILYDARKVRLVVPNICQSIVNIIADKRFHISQKIVLRINNAAVRLKIDPVSIFFVAFSQLFVMSLFWNTPFFISEKSNELE